MKKIILWIMLIMIGLISCSPKETPVDSYLIYTQAASTILAKMTENAVLTPSATMTASPEPTLTASLTPIPSPTVPAPTATWTSYQAGKVTAPILLYYRIAGSNADDANYQWDSTSHIPPELFQLQMQILKDNGFQTITVSQLSNTIRNGGLLPPKPVVITFEVGAVGVYSKAYPIMQKLGFVGTVYLIANQVDAGWMLSTAQIKELIASGWEIGSKGLNGNVDLTTDYSLLSDEVARSKQVLEEKFGVPVKSFSYPYAKLDEMITTRVAEWGYDNGVGVGRSFDHSSGMLFYLMRTEIKKDLAPVDFAAMLPFQPVIISGLPTVPTAPVLSGTAAP
jgi:peptidoglycan/xylan/chitin deacetylase (PgdA/CDA1 family)